MRAPIVFRGLLLLLAMFELLLLVLALPKLGALDTRYYYILLYRMPLFLEWRLPFVFCC